MHISNLSDPKKYRSLFICGLYFLIGNTKGGKSLHSIAIAREYEGDFLFVNEPRSKYDSFFAPFYNNEGALDRASLLTGLASHNSSTIDNKTIIKPDPVLLIIDSIGDLFMSDKKSPGLGKGLSFDQILYFKSIQRKCMERNIVLLATVNSNLVSIANIFEGAIEGLITVTNSGVKMMDRERREEKDLVLSIDSLDFAVKHLGYGESYKKPETNTSNQKDLKVGTYGIFTSIR